MGKGGWKGIGNTVKHWIARNLDCCCLFSNWIMSDILDCEQIPSGVKLWAEVGMLQKPSSERTT